MVNRVFKVKSSACIECGECKINNIPRDEVFQSLGNAKLYVCLDGKKDYCWGGMEMVEEERSNGI